MTVPDFDAVDTPLPDARSQVSLPLESSAITWERGWSVRLPVRAENVLVDKQVVVRERVVVRRREVEDVTDVNATVRKEQLRLEVEQNTDEAHGTAVQRKD